MPVDIHLNLMRDELGCSSFKIGFCMLQWLTRVVPDLSRYQQALARHNEQSDVRVAAGHAAEGDRGRWLQKLGGICVCGGAGTADGLHGLAACFEGGVWGMLCSQCFAHAQ